MLAPKCRLVLRCTNNLFNPKTLNEKSVWCLPLTFSLFLLPQSAGGLTFEFFRNNYLHQHINLEN